MADNKIDLMVYGEQKVLAGKRNDSRLKKIENDGGVEVGSGSKMRIIDDSSKLSSDVHSVGQAKNIMPRKKNEDGVML